MFVDALTLTAIADEWRALLIGARIDTIIQPTEHAIAIQCYARGDQRQSGHNHWLYLSAHPQLARAHITALKPAKIVSEPPPFVMLLRKHLEGARIGSITQPRWERVLEIVADYCSNPVSEQRVYFRLIIEIMGRLSNIILCNQNGLILGSLKRVSAEVNRYRVIAAGVPYVPPPPQQRTLADQTLPRLEPTTLTATQLAECAADSLDDEVFFTERLRGQGSQTSTELVDNEPQLSSAKKRKRSSEQPKLWQLLTQHVLGVSPLLAREAVHRTTEDVETTTLQTDKRVWEELAWNIRNLAALYDTHKWHPQLVERAHADDQTQTLPLAFAVYVLQQYSHIVGVVVRHMPSVNGLLDEYYARAEWRDAMEGVRAPIRKVLQAQRERCVRKATLLQQELAVSEEAARCRLQADLLLAYQHEVQQGQSSVALQNFSDDDLVTIPLDPRFDAVGNANRLYHKYHKLRRALELVPAQIEHNATELATLEQLLADLMLAETPTEVALVKAEAQVAGYIRGKVASQHHKADKRGKGGKQNKPVAPGGGVPLHVQSRDGFTLLIGKNSRQNEEVTFRQARANDIWLHARGVPGAHVIIRAAGNEVPRATLVQAARLAAYYSQARGSTNVPVDYTLQRHVRHMKGGGPGMVVYDKEKTIYVEGLSAP
ncbi:MAG: NFACT family protein [Ktedonobacteraceae bacterium]|nr:NFACT family protein [Ktedonobacteraceae bacterium]